MASKYLTGCDVSLWQATTQIKGTNDFCIVKASEGNTIKDPKFHQHLDRCKFVNIGLVGAYHYAHTADKPEEDAALFLHQIHTRAELGENMILALDLEGEDLARANSLEWSRRWLDIVYADTGIKPLLYTSASYTKKMGIIVEGDYGLWVAHWNVKKPSTGAWPFWAVWQYTVENNALDLDYFNGTKEQYLKYCKSDKM